jgi:chromosome partitioning protein
MQTWAIIAQKGGQSKTTIATAFAVRPLARAAIVILDADDRQGPRSIGPSGGTPTM